MVTDLSLACNKNNIIAMNICLTYKTKRTMKLTARVHSVPIRVTTVLLERQFQHEERIIAIEEKLCITGLNN